MTRNRGRVCLALLLSILVLGAAVGLRAQMPPGAASGQSMPPAMPGSPGGMPDARTMSGIPMPMEDLPDGTVSVRLVRGELSNAIANHPVGLVVNGATRTVNTDDSGRAQFTGLSAGTTAKAVAVVDGERLESEDFTLPAKGGVRLLLAASASLSAAGAPAVAGTVTFGGESRIAVEFDDDTITVFYLLDITNAGSAPVNPTTRVAFELPSEATGASVVEGSSPQAKVKGREVMVSGPFAPGLTSVQIAYQLPPGGDTLTLVQQFPVTFERPMVIVQQTGATRVQSAQLSELREMPGDGKAFILGSGPALAANRPLTLALSGLPHHATWPRSLAVGLALVMLVVGGWMALSPGQAGGDVPRRVLESRREQLFGQLLELEEARRTGASTGVGYDERRAALMNELERIYGELDRGAAVSGGDKGLPA